MGEKERDMIDALALLAPFAVCIGLAWVVLTITRRNQ
jgi:hypothetical protein